MKFPNVYNEIFFKNLIKHDLTQHEFKVILAFIVDKHNFYAAQKILSERTGIAPPNISRALKGLVYQGVLLKQGSNYFLNEEMLSPQYSFINKSSTEMRKVDEATNVKGSGNFAEQSKKRIARIEEMEINLKFMLEETRVKKIVELLESEDAGREIEIDDGRGEVEKYKLSIFYIDKRHVYWKPGGFSSIAPDFATIGYLTYLGLKPKEIVKYLFEDPREFIKKHNLKESTV